MKLAWSTEGVARTLPGVGCAAQLADSLGLPCSGQSMQVGRYAIINLRIAKGWQLRYACQ